VSETQYFEPVFVEFIPAEDELVPGKLYVSMAYATTVHLCASGCGNKVVLPLSPRQYHMTFDGEAISLNHSVGNWEYPCQAHYWIRNNRVQWAPKWDASQIEVGRQRDKRDVESEFAKSTSATRSSLLSAVRRWIGRGTR
jgi:hypothetical protein